MEQENENTNLFLTIFNYIIGKDDNEKEKKDKNVYHVDNIEPFINTFKNELFKIKFIDEEYNFNKKERAKIEKYAEQYLYLKDNLKNNEYYKKSFYEDFKNKIVHIMSYSKDIINNHLNSYLNDIITETKGVIHTINKKFNMNQTEFEKKFSEDVKQNIIIILIKILI